MLRKSMVLAAVAASFLAWPAAAQEKHVEPIMKLVESQMRGWAQKPEVVDAIKAQNAKHASLTQADIEKMDKQWIAETKAGDKPLVNAVLGNSLSGYLKKVKADGKGLYAEIFVMDNKGLNVGQSDVTSDYWQGDEAKWQKTFSAGPKAVLVDKITKDESSQTLTSQVSFTIIDPASGQPIGAVTVGVNVEELGG